MKNDGVELFQIKKLAKQTSDDDDGRDVGTWKSTELSRRLHVVDTFQHTT